MPTREQAETQFEAPALEDFAESLAGSKGRAASTTMGFRQHAAASDEASEDRASGCADYSR